MSMAPEINALRAEIGKLIVGKPPEAILFAFVDGLAVYLAAIAQIDAEEGRQQLEWTVARLREMTAERTALMSARGGSIN